MLITAWLIYTTQMSVLPVETRAVTFLNVGLLLLVAIIPYLLNGVEVVNPKLLPDRVSAIQNYSSTLFALDLGGILLILATFAHVISLEEKKLVAPELVTLFRNGRNRMLILAVLTLVSIGPRFWQRAAAALRRRRTGRPRWTESRRRPKTRLSHAPESLPSGVHHSPRQLRLAEP